MDEDTLIKETLKNRDAAVKGNEKAEKFQRDLELSLIGITDPIERICVLMQKISNNIGKVNEKLKKIEGDLVKWKK